MRDRNRSRLQPACHFRKVKDHLAFSRELASLKQFTLNRHNAPFVSYLETCNFSRCTVCELHVTIPNKYFNNNYYFPYILKAIHTFCYFNFPFYGLPFWSYKPILIITRAFPFFQLPKTPPFDRTYVYVQFLRYSFKTIEPDWLCVRRL